MRPLGGKRREGSRRGRVLAPALGLAVLLVSGAMFASAAGAADGDCDASVANQTQLNAAITCVNMTAGHHVITVTSDITYTTSPVGIVGDPFLGPSVEIDGNGHTIDAAGQGPVFTAEFLADVSFVDITLTGGDPAGGAGGGIFVSSSTVTVTDSIISGNTATFLGGGIYKSGGLGTVTVTNSTISGNTAGSGGGIYSSGGFLLVTGSTISNNSATEDGGGIDNASTTVAVTDSTISNNTAAAGGGISNSGALTVTGSAVSLNTATGIGIPPGSPEDQSGGGVINQGAGTMTVTDSTISANDAAAFGGGIANFSSNPMTLTGSTLVDNTADIGAGISTGAGTVTVTNSTISTNTATVGAGGIAAYNGGLMNLWFSTVTRNTAPEGAGISLEQGYVGANVGASIVADNLGAGGDVHCSPFCFEGEFFSEDFNVIGDGNATLAFFHPQDTIIGTAGAGLGPIQNNGGPTWTHLPDATSPAIDRFNITTGLPSWNQTVDQRGEFRPWGDFPDAGSVEAEIQCGVGPWSAASTFRLNFAIECFNAQVATGAYTIELTGDITLTSSATPINNPTTGVSLQILAMGNTVDADGNGRVFTVDNSEVSFIDITITGGDATGTSPDTNGGGIYNVGGTVSVTGSTISGNSAAARGGGIHNTGLGTVTISDSTISGNDASLFGGGIYEVSGTTTVSNSTISGNIASFGGGGIYNSGPGTVNVWFSTVTGNTAPDGAGIWTVDNATADTFVGASVVADNLGAGGDVDCDAGSCTGNGFSSDGFNVIGDGNATANFAATQDIVIGTAGAGLGPLQNNGGSTDTHLPSVTSPAIDRFNITTGLPTWDQALDQRGVARNPGSKEAGSVELECGVSPWSAADTASLNFALGCFDATTAAGVHTIEVTGDIALTSASTQINNTATGVSLTIDGNGFAVDGADTFQVFEVASGDVTFDSITIRGGNASGGNGGGIRNSFGDVTVSESTISANNAGLGGGVYNSAGSLTLLGSTISGNDASVLGGGFYNAGVLTVSNSTISGNTATASSGGIHNDSGGSVTVVYSTITNNTGPGAAGIRSSGDASTSTSVSASIVADNIGNDVGIFNGATNSFVSNGYNVIGTGNATGTFVATQDTVIGTAGAGLGLLQDNGGATETHLLDVTSPAIDRFNITTGLPPWDQAFDQRGVARPQGVFKDAGSVELACEVGPWSVSDTDDLNFAIGCFNATTATGVHTIEVTSDITLTSASTPIDNSALNVLLQVDGMNNTVDADDNGSVFTVTSGVAGFANITLTGGDAVTGGGINNSGTATVTGSTISGNSATTSGGGIYNSAGGTATVSDSTISANSASTGGGIYSDGTVTVSNSTISGNSATTEGGGIHNEGDTLNVWLSTITDNTAPFAAGVLVPDVAGTDTFVGASIIADNNGGGGDVDCDGGSCPGNGFTSEGFNVIGDGGATGDFSATQDTVIGTAGAGLGPLQNNGGSTETHLPVAASPAVDRFNITGLPWDEVVDQRGVARPQPVGGSKDSGSVELGCGFGPLLASDTAGLNLAIACFNAATDAGVYSVELTGDITMTSASTVIDNSALDVSLQVDGMSHTVDADGNGSVFTVANGDVSFVDVTLTGGNATGASPSDTGGGINNSGTVTVTDSTISDNTALSGGGIYNSGTVAVTDSTVSDNTALSGAGIYNSGTVTLAGSTISGNAAAAGGGVFNSGTATVTTSTLRGNTASSIGAGINNVGSGTSTVSNSTISGNNATNQGGGIHNTGDTVNVWFSTITGNTSAFGAGVLVPDVVGTNTFVGASIIADNNGGDVECAFSTCTGFGFTSEGYNVIGIGSATGDFTAGQDIVIGTAGAGLGPLADNGGPTETHLPGSGSPAVDRYNIIAGLPAWDEALDQRGETRAAGSKDAGSVELDLVADCGVGPWSAATTFGLNFAIGCFNTQTAAGVYMIDVTADITMTSASTAIDNTAAGVLLQVDGMDNTVDADDNGSVFTVTNGDVTFSNITLTGGDATGASGGGIYSDGGTVTVSDSTISDNTADDGAGIYNGGAGTLTVTGSTISGNTADDGGGINNPSGTATVSDSTISDNTANNGGGINNFGMVTVSNSTISGNIASFGGGGINNSDTVTVSNSTISGNTASSGAGIRNDGTVNAWFSTITANTSGFGAGVLTLSNTGNSSSVGASVIADNNGGGGDVLCILSLCTSDGFTSEGFNVIGDGSAAGDFTATQDTVIGSGAGLGPLQDNGGSTETHLPGAGSQAIDRFDITTGLPIWDQAFDQRGVARPLPVGGFKDAGSVEVAFVPPSCVDDVFEENDDQASATALSSGVQVSAVVCAGDFDWFKIPVTAGGEITVDALFTHAVGDINIELHDPTGTSVASSGSTTDDEQIVHTATMSGDYLVRVFGFAGAENTYDLTMTAVPVGLCNGKVPTLVVPPGGVDFFGTTGDDVILGTPGVDRIFGLGGNDDICGEADGAIVGGDDNLNGGNGLDTIFGGPGNDFVGGQGGVDQLFGGDGDDEIAGGIGDDVMRGGDGEDIMRGQGNNDQIFGEGDVDTIFGGSGHDIIETGPGGNLGTAHVVTGNGNNDTITGSPDADLLDGQNGLDIIFGEGGNDTLTGGLGFDRLNGGDGNDTLEGFGSRDILHGDGDDDIVNGGAGDDDLYGDAGANDVCNGGPGTDATPTGNGCETVTGVP